MQAQEKLNTYIFLVVCFGKSPFIGKEKNINFHNNLNVHRNKKKTISSVYDKTEKSQHSGQRIMPETRFTSF